MGRVSKSIAIIGEGETEWFYFDSLRISRRFPFKMAPDFPSHPYRSYFEAGTEVCCFRIRLCSVLNRYGSIT